MGLMDEMKKFEENKGSIKITFDTKENDTCIEVSTNVDVKCTGAEFLAGTESILEKALQLRPLETKLIIAKLLMENGND